MRPPWSCKLLHFGRIDLRSAMAAAGAALLQVYDAPGTSCDADEELELYPDTDDESLYTPAPSTSFTYPGGVMSYCYGFDTDFGAVGRATTEPLLHGRPLGFSAFGLAAESVRYGGGSCAFDVMAAPSTRSLSGSFDAWSSAASCLGDGALVSPGETTRPQSPEPATCSPRVDGSPGLVLGSEFVDLQVSSLNIMKDQHLSGTCRPCPWFWRDGGCRNGGDCAHCHLCSADVGSEYRRAKMLRRKKLRAKASGPAEVQV